MGRPLYETKEQTDNESLVMTKINKIVKCSAVKLPIKYQLDYALTRLDKIKAFVEIKTRSNTRDTYPTYMISLDKCLQATKLGNETGIPSILCVDWVDETLWCHFHDVLHFGNYEMGGRHDRGDWQDIEPVVKFTLGIFRPIPNLKVIIDELRG